MNALGLIVNTLAIVVAGLIGSAVRGKLKVFYQKLILQILGAAVLVMGVLHAWQGLFVLEGAQFETTGTLLVVFAVAVGLLFGEAMRLDLLLDKLGELLRRLSEHDRGDGEDRSREKAGKKHGKNAKTDKKHGKNAQNGKNGKSAGATAKPSDKEKKDAIREAKRAARVAERGQVPGQAPRLEDTPPSSPSAEPTPAITVADGKPKRTRFADLPTYELSDTRTGHLFTDGFALATLLCVCNALTFTGAIAAGTYGETELLFTKAIIDAVIVLVLSSVYGGGAAFAALPLFLAEGGLTLFSTWKPDLMTNTLIDHFTIVAAAMTVGAGLCMMLGKRWRVINLAPAFCISPIYGLVMLLVEKYADK